MRKCALVQLVATVGAILALASSCGPHHSAVQTTNYPTNAFTLEHQSLVAKNPEGVSFTIRLIEPSARFRQGERIRIELSFSSRVQHRYQLNDSGQLVVDRDYVDPSEGAVDPLVDYQELGGDVGGGVRSIMLGEEPRNLVFDLNEWLRFDKPGRYHLYVESTRILYEREESSGDRVITSASVVSNVIAFEVVPAEPEWARQRLAEATRAYDQATGSNADEQRRDAARLLRFLATPEATREIAHRLQGDPIDIELLLGLVGSPHRKEAIAALEAKLDAPDFPVSTTFFHMLVLMRDKLDNPGALGPYPREDNSVTWADWQARARQVLARRGFPQDLYATRLLEQLGRKTVPARAVSLLTLLEVTWINAEEVRAWYPELEAQIPDLFSTLPQTDQMRLLQGQWRRVAGPSVLPVLRVLADSAALTPEDRAIVIQHLYELAPGEGRDRILGILRTGSPSLGVYAYTTLAILPDTTLPEIDGALASRFETCMGMYTNDDLALISKLLARYATQAIEARVAAALANRPAGSLGEDIIGSLIAFFVRTDPARADVLAQRELGRAATTGSIRSLEIAAELAMGPPLERALLQALDRPDAKAAASAAHALGEHGSPLVESKLWERLERWHATCKGREEADRNRLIEPNPNEGEAALGGALWRAIATSPAWLADGGKLARLDDLLLTTYEKQRLRSMLADWAEGTPTIRIFRFPNGSTRAGVAQYDFDSIDKLEAKLAQFPTGARFMWQPGSGLPDDYDVIRAFLAARGMVLERMHETGGTHYKATGHKLR